MTTKPYEIIVIGGGSAGIVSAKPRLEGVGAPWIQVSDDRTALAVIAANLYGRPTEKLHAVGVTGSTFVANRSGSPYGAEWSFSGTDALVTVASSGSFAGSVLNRR